MLSRASLISRARPGTLASHVRPYQTRAFASARLPPTLHVLRRDAELSLASNKSLASDVTAYGWIVSVRRHKTRTFLELTDGTMGGGATMQVVLSGDIRELTPGQAIQLHGQMKAGRGRSASQRVEIQADHVAVLAPTDLATYPLANMMQGNHATSAATDALTHTTATDIVRRESHFKARTPQFAALQRTRARMEHAMGAWMAANDFCKVHPPIITSSDCEGGGEIFQVVADADVPRNSQETMSLTSSRNCSLAAFWSGQPAYLTVSTQLHLEAYALGLSRVWSLCPVFRAEGSATNRHLAEFWMLEAEMCWLPDGEQALRMVLDVTESVLKSALQAAWHDERANEDMAFLGATYDAALIDSPWPRLSYTDAVRLLRAHTKAPPVWGESLKSEHERWLASHMGQPVFVTNFPTEIKPFYMRENPEPVTLSDDVHPTESGSVRKTVACFDLLVPQVGELVGGSVREERHGVLMQRLRTSGLQASSLTWYTDDLRRYGGAPHGGFGLGMERFLSWVTHTFHVRDLVGFPRVKGPLRY